VASALVPLCCAALVLGSLGACGRPASGTFTIDGVLRLLNSGQQGFLSSSVGFCHGAGNFVDIADGTVVTVSAGTDTVATGYLRTGRRASPIECDWTILVDKVPAGRVRYTIAVGAGPQSTFSEGDLRGRPVMTLGG